MKICIINNIYKPFHRGGAEQVVISTVEGLLARGHEVVLITTTPKDEEIEEHNNLKIYRFKPKNIFYYTFAHEHSFIERGLWHAIDIFNVAAAKRVKEILIAERPDVVHTHNLMGISFLIPRYIRKLGLKHVHTVHDVQLVEPSAMIIKTKENTWRYHGLPTRIYTWVMKKLLGSPDVVISPSQFLLDFYRSRGFFSQSSRHVLRNPMTFDFEITKAKEKTGDRFDFLYLGQIEHHKGVFLLLQAFEKMQQAHLHIAGSGSQLEELRAKAKDMPNVTFYGRVSREKLPELFSQVDMTVVPSLCYENSPTVIFESLYFSVPVLASRIEGIAELISEGNNGFTFEAGSLGSLVEKLSWCIDNKEAIKNMSKKIPTQKGSEEIYFAELLQLYQS